MEDYLTPKQAAERKGVATTTIYEAVKRGAIPAYKFMGRIGLLLADVESWDAATYGGVERTRKRRGPTKKSDKEKDAPE